MGHLFVLEFSDGSVKVGHANTPGKRVISSARSVGGRMGTTLANRWVSAFSHDSEECARRLVHWAYCTGAPVYGYRGVFVGVDFNDAVAMAEHLVEGGTALLLTSAFDLVTSPPPVPGTLAHRLRDLALSGISP
jgi:hypothetical protein